jgi:hypothetical protein
MVTAFGTHSDLQRRFVPEDPLRSATFYVCLHQAKMPMLQPGELIAPSGRPGGRCNFDFAIAR